MSNFSFYSVSRELNADTTFKIKFYILLIKILLINIILNYMNFQKLKNNFFLTNTNKSS